MVWARREIGGAYRLRAQPLDTEVPLATKTLKVQAFAKSLKALDLADAQISRTRKSLEDASETQIGFMSAARIFSVPDLIAAGFESTSPD